MCWPELQYNMEVKVSNFIWFFLYIYQFMYVSEKQMD
jgi:hypothetical protein